MSVILHAANGVDENPLLLANARRVGPYLRSKFCRDGFAPILGAEHDMNYILSVGVRHVSHLRCWPFYTLGTPRSRAGLTCDAPTALEEGGTEQSGQERVKKLVPVGRVLLFGPVASNLREAPAASDLRARVLITLLASRRSTFGLHRAPQSEPSR